MDELMHFELPVNKSSIIKVLGVGGGGSNAVNHMFRQGIKDVDFIVCNTDAQALANSPVPVKIQLGASLTEGGGAGNKPEVGRQAAIESLDNLSDILIREHPNAVHNSRNGWGNRHRCCSGNCQSGKGTGYTNGGHCHHSL